MTDVEFGFGLITCQRPSGDYRSDWQIYNEAIELAEAAEHYGFDSVWLSEHHFFDDAHLPSMLTMAAAIAARTQRIRIGTAVLLAPLYASPVRLAEDVATVDVLSGGRFILGLGAGWREEEFRLLGIPLAERRRRLWDTVRVLREAWSPVGDGEYSVVTPKPVQPGGPPIWIGAGAKRAVMRAGQFADGFIGNFYADPPQFGKELGWCRESLEERAGTDAAWFSFSLQIPTVAWDDPADWEEIRDGINHIMFKYDQHGEDRREPDGTTMAPPPITPSWDAVLRSRGVFGTTEEVTARIREYVDVAGGRLHFIARMYLPGLDRAVQLRIMERFASKVMPALRREEHAGLGGTPA